MWKVCISFTPRVQLYMAALYCVVSIYVHCTHSTSQTFEQNYLSSPTARMFAPRGLPIDMVLRFLTVTIHRLHPKHLGSDFYSPVGSGPHRPLILIWCLAFYLTSVWTTSLPVYGLHPRHLDFTSTCCKKVCTSSTPHSLTNALSGRLILLLSCSTQLKIGFSNVPHNWKRSSMWIRSK